MTDANEATWPHRGNIAILVNPARKREVKKGLLVLAGVLGTLFLIYSIVSDSSFQRWVRHRQDVVMRPAMIAAMERGSEEATNWLAMRFREDYPGLLEKQAEKGNAEAMYWVGRMQKDEARGRDLVHRAAQQGSPLAVEYELNHSLE